MSRYGSFTPPKSCEKLKIDTFATTESLSKKQAPGELDDTILNGLTFLVHRYHIAGQFEPEMFNQFKPEEIAQIKERLFKYFDISI